MNVELICFHKTTDSYLIEGVEIYLKKIKPYFKGFIYKELTLPSSKKSEDSKKQLNNEWIEIQKHINGNPFLVLLDENGKHFSSVDLASYIEKFFVHHSRTLLFIIGGPFGFHPDLKLRADLTISLSKMTFTHQMVRLIFLEQLYRAGTIMKGEPYHHL